MHMVIKCLYRLRARVTELKEVFSALHKERDFGITNIWLQKIADDASKVAFYTGFPTSSYTFKGMP